MAGYPAALIVAVVGRIKNPSQQLYAARETVNLIPIRNQST
jgi:hypothetical protein